MRQELLVIAALLLPLVWGYTVSRLVERFWPFRQPLAEEEGTAAAKNGPPLPVEIRDYVI